MFELIIGIIVLLAVLLVLVVLAQNSKGGAGAAFGGSASQVMGVTKTGNILEKTTCVLALAIMALALVSSIFLGDATQSTGISSPNLERAQDQIVTPPSFDTEEGDAEMPIMTDTTGE